jgi:hypothetical protein
MSKIQKKARVVIDDDRLVKQAVRLGGHRTTKDTVTEALEEYIRRRKQMRIIDLFGKIDFDPKPHYRKQRRRK